MWHKTRQICWVLLLFLAGVPAFASIKASLTIKGSEQPGDAGKITISFDGLSETVAYGQYSSPAAVASAFGAMFSRDFTSKLCAHAVGSTVLFTVKGDAVLGPVAVTGSTTSFQVDTSLWPTNLINPLVELECDPSTITSGNTSFCTASVGGSATGTVAFSLDGGSPFATVSLSSGSATVSNVLSGAAIGTHLITAMYSGDATHAAGGVDASIMIRPIPGSLTPTTIYSYSITQPDGSTSGYAANGNVLAYIDSVNGTWSNIGYDSLNRLTAAQQAPVGASPQYFCWAYDSFGNRTLQASSPAAFQTGSPNCQAPSGVTATTYIEGYDTSNHLTSTPFSNPASDASGNLLSDDMNQYLYDGDGRVCAVKSPPFIAGEPSSLTQYVYDADGTRVAKGMIATFSCDITSNGFTLTNSYALDQEGHQVTETDGNGQWMHTNVYAGGMMLATYDNNGTHFHITDWLGSRRVQADYLGRVEESYQNLPFGEFAPNNNTTSLGATEQHFTGKERDAESGNDYFEARYLGSSMGRFLSPDPVGGSLANPQTLNKYAYVLNNPLTNTDPTGLYACKDGKDGACTSDQDKAYEASRQHDLQSKNADVRRGAAAMGDPGKEVVNARGDKVTVGFADLGKSGEGGVTHSELGSNDKGDPISVSNVTINSNSRGTALDADVGHEGSHVADAQDMAGSITYTSTSFHVGQDISQYASEQRAYRVTDAIYRSANESYNGCGNANCALGAGSSPVGIPGRVDAILLANPNIYHGLNGKPMTSTNQGGNVLGVVVPH